MRFASAALAVFALLGAATADDLPEIIDDFPACGLLCFSRAAEENGCKNTDLKCICEHQVKLAVRVGTCMNDACGDKDDSRFDTGKQIGKLCAEFADDPDSDEVVSATAAIVSKVSSVSATAGSATATGTSASKPTNAAAMETGSFVMMGAAALAALAL